MMTPKITGQWQLRVNKCILIILRVCCTVTLMAFTLGERLRNKKIECDIQSKFIWQRKQNDWKKQFLKKGEK